MGFKLHVSFRGRAFEVALRPENPGVQLLVEALQIETGVSVESMKLVNQSLKRPVHLANHLEGTVANAGAESGLAVLFDAGRPCQTLHTVGWTGSQYYFGGRLLFHGDFQQYSACYYAGLTTGSKVMLIASTAVEVAAIKSSKEMPGLATFEHELRRLEQRRKKNHAFADALQVPRGRPYLFERPFRTLSSAQNLCDD